MTSRPSMSKRSSHFDRAVPDATASSPPLSRRLKVASMALAGPRFVVHSSMCTRFHRARDAPHSLQPPKTVMMIKFYCSHEVTYYVPLLLGPLGTPGARLQLEGSWGWGMKKKKCQKNLLRPRPTLLCLCPDAAGKEGGQPGVAA
jgi:hypothetical protein